MERNSSGVRINVRRPQAFHHLPKLGEKSYTYYKTKLPPPKKIWEKPSDKTLKKFSLPDKPVDVKIFDNDEPFLSYRNFTKQQRVIAKKQRQVIPINQKYKINATDIRNRLHIHHPPDDVKTITDIDESFYKYINGRPLRKHGTYFKSLIVYLNESLRKKMEIGYCKDSVLNIDLNFIKENKKYDAAVVQCMKQVKYFDQFISEDYRNSMTFLEKWEKVKNKVHMKNVELQNVASQIFTITSKLIILDYKYGLQQKYGRFLYYLSPPTWRAQNRDFAQSIEIEATGFEKGAGNDDDSFSVLFDKMQKECGATFVKPVLYFNLPSELIKVFDTIEQHQQHHFIHVGRIAPLVKSLVNAKTCLKEIVTKDTAVVKSSVEAFENSIDFYDKRSKQLENKFFKILHGMFYQTVGAAEVLKLSLHLEFCFEKLCDEKPINMDIVAMAKAIEDTYMFYAFELEGFRGENVKKAVAQCIHEEKVKNRKAKQAVRELRLFERLKHELLLSFPPVPEKGKIIFLSNKDCSRSADRAEKKHSLKKDTEVKKKSLNESEIEYLKLFTDWTENQDPSLFLHG